MGRRKRWDELEDWQKTEARWSFDLEEGESESDWWEAFMDSIEEDGSWKAEGWPFGE